MNDTPEQSKRLDDLQQRLDSRSGEAPRSRRSGFQESSPNDLPEDWEHSHESPKDGTPHMKEKKERFAKLFLTGSIVFFVIALGVGAFFISRGNNTISSSNIDISVSGPATVAGGDLLELDISVTNRNNALMEVADLVVEFPEGTRDSTDVGIEQKRIRTSLGDIRPGDRVQEKVSGIVFGMEGDQQGILVTVEYRVTGSNAIFVKERLYEYEISSSPLSLRVELPSEVNAGQEISAVVTVTSNTEEVLEHVILEAAYPFGFRADTLEPDSTFDDDVWVIGDLPPGGKRTIQIDGLVEGQDGEERTFQFTVGLQDEDDEKEVGVVFLTAKETVNIARPFIALSLTLNGEAGETVVTEGGEIVRGDIAWTNNLTTPLRDVTVSARIEGETLNESSVSALSGFYNSGSNTVVWDSNTNDELDRIDPGDTGRVSFTFKTSDLTTASAGFNPTIVVDVDMEGERLDDDNVAGIVMSNTTKTVQLASDLLLNARTVYNTGPFTNTGPIPPVVEEDTTYTVIWTVTNSANEVRNAEVRATLPSYVTWLGETSPGSETITFSDVGGEAVWEVGTVAAGAGYTTSAREVAFQIRLTPSVSQLLTSPVIVGQSKLSGTDVFTGTSVGDTRNNLTTRTTTDPGYSEADGRVVE